MSWSRIIHGLPPCTAVTMLLRSLGCSVMHLTGESRLRFSARGDLLEVRAFRRASLASLSLLLAGLHFEESHQQSQTCMSAQ